MLTDTQMYMFSNVHLKLKDKKTHRIIKEINKKNTVTKYALNGIASMLKGEFTDNNYNKINNYVPKYLALGTNLASQRGDNITVGASVTVFDDSLLSEIKMSNGNLIRVRLEDVKRVDNTVTNEYVKIRYRTAVTSGTVPYTSNIQELGLFTDNTDIKGGLWARIAVEPITIPENSILDVIWDVVIASSIGVYPSAMTLYDSSDTKIDESTVALVNGDIYPIAVNLRSSIIDGTTIVKSLFNVVVSESKLEYVSTNNFSSKTKYITVYQDGNDTSNYKVKYKYDNGSYTILPDTGYYTETEAKSKANELAYIGIDISGNIVEGDGNTVNAYTYKDVTYKNCMWNISLVTDTETTVIDNYVAGTEYSKDAMVIKDSGIYCCTATKSSTTFIDSEWTRIMTFMQYMSNAVIINSYDGTDTIKFKIDVSVSTGISSYFYVTIGG